jgi:hypothetical protein
VTTIDQLQAHGIPSAADGGVVETKTVVHTAEQLRALLDLGLDDQGRQEHYEALFGGTKPVDDDGGLLSRRIAAHVIGNASLSDEDRAAIAPAFPLTAYVTAAAGPLTISSAYDLSTPDGSVRIVSFTDVVMNQGGYFVCESTPLTFTCETLTRNGNSGSSIMADFNILGKVGSTPQPPPAPPGNQTQASPGAPGQCTSAGVAGSGGGAGSPGQTGTHGTAGSPGGDGTPSMQASITIQKTLTAAQLTVRTQSGPGGQGGAGGAGGAGQIGGRGGDGATCDCTGNGGGPGGTGGQGGDGGAGGAGGNGVDAAGNVAIRVPTTADTKKVQKLPQQALPGPGGLGGPGGAGGGGGYGGSGGKGNAGGGNGGSGNSGAYGPPGQSGTRSGAPGQISPILA